VLDPIDPFALSHVSKRLRKVSKDERLFESWYKSLEESVKKNIMDHGLSRIQSATNISKRAIVILSLRRTCSSCGCEADSIHSAMSLRICHLCMATRVEYAVITTSNAMRLFDLTAADLKPLIQLSVKAGEDDRPKKFKAAQFVSLELVKNIALQKHGAKERVPEKEAPVKHSTRSTAAKSSSSVPNSSTTPTCSDDDLIRFAAIDLGTCTFQRNSNKITSTHTIPCTRCMTIASRLTNTESYDPHTSDSTIRFTKAYPSAMNDFILSIIPPSTISPLTISDPQVFKWSLRRPLTTASSRIAHDTHAHSPGAIMKKCPKQCMEWQKVNRTQMGGMCVGCLTLLGGVVEYDGDGREGMEEEMMEYMGGMEGGAYRMLMDRQGGSGEARVS